MSKLDPAEQRIQGKVWDCSRNLKTKQRVEFIIDESVEREWNKLCDHPDARVFTTDRMVGVTFNDTSWPGCLPVNMRAAWESFITQVRRDHQLTTPGPLFTAKTLRGTKRTPRENTAKSNQLPPLQLNHTSTQHHNHNGQSTTSQQSEPNNPTSKREEAGTLAINFKPYYVKQSESG